MLSATTAALSQEPKNGSVSAKPEIVKIVLEKVFNFVHGKEQICMNGNFYFFS